MKTEVLRSSRGRFAVAATALLSLLLPADAAFVPAAVETTGGSVQKTVLEDQSTVVKFLADGTFTVPAGATGRILLVAGGGGGGFDCSGGGGAGGMIEASDLVFSAGTYTVTVGAGGAGSTSTSVKGGNGGDTILAFGGSALYTAVGGGGGGSWGSVNGAAGGSGGGATGQNGGTGGAGTEGQGYAGGNAGGRAPAGGGGAGGAAVKGTNATGPGTAGGPGRASDITGEEVYYAGGGGGGGYNYATGPLSNGGIGGGGNGARNVSVATRQGTTREDGRNEYAAECGVDGLGGGGGGGNNTDHVGRPGGSGVLIVRLDPVDATPDPQLYVLGATDGPESATVRVRVATAGKNASSASVSYAVATSAAALDEATPVSLGSDFANGDAFSFEIPGLTAGTTYYVRILAENERGETSQTEAVECLPYASLASATAVGAAQEFNVGRDRVAVFGASAETMTFTLAERAAVELLLVGGGGGGGSYVGGGGGAGGFLHLETAVLDAGTYTVAVGAGGAQATASSLPGGDGGDTTLSLGGTVLYAAHGGGGGGGNDKAAQRAGRSGGSGGGGGNQNGTAGSSTATGAERGNPGGANDSAHSSWSIGSGGGGAGAPGSHADYASGVGGAGGDGLPCSITGEEVWYAGGGGAGQNYDTVGSVIFSAGLGGRGGGGMGCRTADSTLDDYERGVDGLGGGGGGGRKEGDNAAGKPRWGAPGGSGTLIVRWRATADATARATVDSVAGSVCGAIVSGSVQLAGADAAGATLEMAVGPAGGSLGAFAALGSGLRDGERFTLTLSGLASGADYDYAIRVVSGGAAGDALGAATGSFSTFLSAPAALSGDPENAVKTTVGTDTVYAFSTPGTYSFTVATRGRARFLMVGGGGAGGTSRGGGGGAGGFIERPTVTLEPGVYTVVVGDGGAVNTAKTGVGGDGGDTVLSLGGATLYTAHGGGGGGYGDDVKVAGRAGGSSGGAGPCSDVVTAPTAVPPELGNAGGKGSGSTAGGYNSAAAGGGGAGGPGADGHSSDAASGSNRRQAGNGGAGVASDITGETLWYAGGGGGGTWYDSNGGYKGLGGSGVGGNGGGYTAEVNQGAVAPTAGAAGTGSGGGGGVQYNNCSDAARRGAAGGCGAFILRLAADESSDLPEVVLETLSAGSTSVDAVLALRNTGSEPTADLSLAYGAAEDALDLSAPVAAGAEPGLHSVAVAGLAPGRTWYFAPVASNAGGAVTGAVRSATLPAAGALPAGDGSFGLWQITRATTSAAFAGVFTNASLWAEAASSNVVSGALAADARGYVFEDPATGLSYVWPQPPAIAAYRGWIYLEGGRTVVFGSRCADSVYVAVDGRTLISVVKSAKTETFGSIETEESGWHEIEVRVGHQTGTFGPDGDGNASWSSFGVAFNANGSTSPMPESGWTRLVDPGDGSLLRPSRPEARTIALVSQAVANGSLALGAKVGSGENAAHAYLVYGDEDAGTASTNAWDHIVDLGEVPAANAAEDLTAQVPLWGAESYAARLVLETEGMLAWTEPVTYAATALPALSAVVVSGLELGDRATVSATVSGGSAPYAATLLVGTDADSLAAAATVSVPAAGGFSFSVSELPPGTKHFFQVVVRDASGATARSEVLSFVTPGASRVYDYTDGNTEALWQAANPFENRQRTIVFGGMLTELGAGETTVRLLRNQAPYSFPDARSTEPHVGEELVIPATGAYTLPVLLDWDLDYTWNWSVSNGTETLSRGPTADARDRAWSRHTTVVDATTYTWAGGDGLWTDPGSWTPDGVWDDVAGYPRRGSYAVFTAGVSVVSVPDTALTNRFSRLTLQAGADVTIRAADGAADATLRMQSEDNVSSGRSYGYSQGKSSTLRFAGAGLYVDLYNSWAWYPGDTDTSIVFADGVRARIGTGGNNYAWTANGKARSLFCVTNGAEVSVLGAFVLNGSASQLVVDGAKFLQTYYGGDNSGVFLRTSGAATKPAAVVIRGAAPVLQAGRRFVAQSSDSGTSPQYVDFEVPEGGWAEAPIRTTASNTYQFGQGGTSTFKLVLRVPTNSPAALAGETLDVPLVRWPTGFNTNAVELSTNNLPHPATDFFYTAFDKATGQTNLMAHLVGWADSDAPQASDIRLANLVPGSAEIAFVAIPGRAAGSCLATAVSAQVVDGNGDPVEGATVVLSADSVSAPDAVTAAISGLAENASLALRITLSDGTHDPVATDFAFVSAGDYGQCESETAVVTRDGPFTLWTFTNAPAGPQKLTVTRPGLARILVVGGGGSGGGGDSNDTNTGNSRRGGGGGGGGEVVETELYLQPGDYCVFVGEGGASVGVRTLGKTGGFSTFDYRVTANGGGGGGGNWSDGSKWHREGAAGANGGGAAGGGEGGAATAAGGHAGGAGTLNSFANWSDCLAAGGGGSSGGAGGDSFLDARDMFSGGNGADGVPSDITGSVAWYGGGGGGGGSGLAFGPGRGGLGGRGGGGEGRGFYSTDEFSLVSSRGADGFGGGGGGGSSGGNGSVDASLQAYCGGAGGSGVVIVRMRTATAKTPDPQISVVSAAPGAGGLDLSLAVHSPGAGETDLLFAFDRAEDYDAEAGFAHTNALGPVSSTGLVSRAAAGLRPGTDYVGSIVATNAAGGFAEIPLGAFRTAAETHGDADPCVVAGSWTLGAWTENDASAFSDNLLRAANGTTVRRSQNRRKSSTWGSANSNASGGSGDMIDAVVNRTSNRFVAYGTNDLLVFTLPEPSAVSALRFFAGWGIGNEWSPISIERVFARSAANEDWAPLEGTTFRSGRTTTWGTVAELAAGGKDWLARDARQILVLFNRNDQRDGTIYWEIEADGAAEADLPAPRNGDGRARALVAGPTLRVADGISGSVSISAGEPALDGVFAVWGAVHGGEDTNDWAHILALGPVGTASAAFPLALSDAELGDAAYVRFVGFGSDGTVSWSDSVYVPDVEPADESPPVVVFGACDAGTTSADIAAVLVFAGSGATDGRADLYLQYSQVPGAFDDLQGPWTGNERLLASGVPAGATNLVATWLRPGRNYTARLVARDAAGGEGVSEAFDFSTSVEVDFTGGTWGLRQAKFTDVPAFVTRDYPAVPLDAEVVEGVIMADTSQSARSSRTGEEYSWGESPKNLGFAYAGAIFLEAGTTYTLGENFDDGVRIEIDGEAVLDNRAYATASYADYVCTRTGWHSFKLWLFQDSGGVGWRSDRFDNHSVAWNTAGVKSTGSPGLWRGFVDPGDGSLLWSVFPRAPVVEGFDRDGDALVLTVSVPAADDSCALYAVWGVSNAGADETAWDHSDLVDAEVPAAAQTITFRIADASEAPIVRFYTRDATGAMAWSESCYADFSAPIVRNGGVTHDGDRATVTANLLSAGEGELVLVVQWADDESMSGARSQAIATSGPGVYTATIEVEPGATTYYRFVAQNRNGETDITPTASFTTLAGSRLATTASPSGLSHHTVSLNGSLAVLGAGETEVWLYAGTDPGALEPLDSRVLVSTGSFSFQQTFPGDPHQVWFAFKSVNLAPGGASWESWSSTGSVTTVDSLTYTWRQDVAAGAWNDPSNWIPSDHADDCIGYPNHANAAVEFANGTVATVTVPGVYRFGSWAVFRNDLDVTFVGDGPGVSGLNGDMQGGSGGFQNFSMTFSGLSFTESNGVTFGDTGSHDSTLRVTDGAVVSFGDAVTAAGSNVWIVVDGGATLACRKNGPALGMKDGGILVDGGTISAARILTDYNWNETTNQTIRISGAAPRIELSTAFRNASDSPASLQNADTAFLFAVPKGGWTDPAISSETAAEAFGAMLGGGAGRYVLALDPKSAVFLREGTHVVPLVAWAGGIDTNHVALAPAPENAELVWTYGWPSTATAPAAAGDLPTGVRAVVQGANLSVASVEAAEGGVLATVSLDEYDAGAEGFSVSIEVASSPDGFGDPDFVFAYAGNPATEPGDFGILATGLSPATPYWVRAVVAPSGGGAPSHSAVRPLASTGEGRMAYSGAGSTFLSARAFLSAAGAGSSGAKARLEASFTADFAALCAASREIRIDDGADATLTVEDLVPATNYWLRVRFTNDRGFVFYATDAVARATLADPIDRGIVFVPGLVQARLSGGSNWADDVWTHSTAVHVPGMLMASTTQKATNPYDGKDYNWGDNQTWGYVGQMWMEGGRTYWFARNIDDRAYAKIDGTVVFGSASTASFTPAETGWHDVDFRAGNDGGGHGPNNGTIGFGWNADGISSFTTETFQEGGAWTKAMDPGDGTMLRVVYSATPFMAIDSVAVENGALSVAASFADVPSGSASFEAFYGIEDCGIEEGKWTGHAAVASPSPGDTASATYGVPGAGDAAFVIFKLCGTDSANVPWRQWSRVYDIAPGRPSFRLEGGLVAFTNLGWTAFCTGIGDGATTVAAELQLSTEADFSVTNQTVAFPYGGVGAADLAFAGLETNKVYYARVAGVNDRGEWGYSGTLERRTLLPGPPVPTILPDFAGFMSGSWYATLNDFGFGGARARVWIEVSESGLFDDALVFGDFDVDAVPFTTDDAVVATGLKPGTLYRVRTHARNDWGVEGVSAAIDLRTLGEPFVMTDVGSIAGETGSTLLTIECVQIEEGATYSVSFAVDGSTLKTYANRTGLGTYTAPFHGDPGSTHRCVVTVQSRFGGMTYARAYETTFVIGDNAYAIGSLADLRSIPMRIGDKLVLPALTAAEDHYVLLDIRSFELLEDGRTIRAVAPGFTAVAAYEYDPRQDALVRNETMGLAICLPECKGRVFVAKETTADWNWSDASKWINMTDPEAAPSYPNGVGDVAMAPLAKDRTLTLDVDATVGALYIGWDAAVPPSGSIRLGGANGTLTFRTGERDRPGLLRITGLGRWDVIEAQPFFYLGGSSTAKRLGLSVPDGLEFDGGKHPDRVDLSLRDNHNRIIFRSGYGLPLEIPAGKTLRLFNFDHAWYGGDGQMPNTSRIIWGSGFPFAGEGTIVYDGPVGYFDSALRDFEGTLVIRQGQRFDACGVDSRGGGFWLKANQGYASTRSVFRIEGEVPYSDSLRNAVGLATWGSTHGWGAWGPGDNCFGGRAMVFAGGTLLQRGNNERYNAWQNAGIYKNPNRSDALVVAEGFSSIDQTSFNSSVPTNRMEFGSLRHENRGTIRVSTTDTGTYGGSIPETQSHCIVRGFGEHAIGAGGAPGSNRESIVPWIVCSVQWGHRLYFPFSGERDGETDCLVRGLTHPVSKDSLAAATDPGENVFVNGKTIALESDVAVNSLCLNDNWSKGTALGAGRTLTISSGGLILESDRTAVGREAEWKDGTAGTVLFPNEAYVYSTRNNLSSPNEIWASIVAPKGLAISYPGHLLLGGDQTGIDGELVVNGCDVTLGSAAEGCRIDVPVRLESGAATLRIGKAGSFCRRPLHLNDHAGFGPKFVPLAGTTERLGLTYVNGVNLRKGTYGSSESGADHIDDNHFSGTGVAQVCVDETDKASMLILR